MLVKWNLCRPQKIWLESSATIEKLQKELDDKQASFDATIIKMQEEHAEAILLAQQRDIEVNADGKVENAGSEKIMRSSLPMTRLAKH